MYVGIRNNKRELGRGQRICEAGAGGYTAAPGPRLECGWEYTAHASSSIRLFCAERPAEADPRLGAGRCEGVGAGRLARGRVAPFAVVRRLDLSSASSAPVRKV